MTHGAKNGGGVIFSNDGPKHIKLNTVDIWILYNDMHWFSRSMQSPKKLAQINIQPGFFPSFGYFILYLHSRDSNETKLINL